MFLEGTMDSVVVIVVVIIIIIIIYYSISFMVTPCIKDIKHFIVQLMRTTLKMQSYYNSLKLRRLLQHVSVYKETVIREPQPVLS